MEIEIDEDTSDLLQEYATEMSKIHKHILDNPLIEPEYAAHFFLSSGTAFYKFGSAILNKYHPDELNSHKLILVPAQYLDEAREALKIIQNKHLTEAYDIQIKAAKSDKESEIIKTKFDSLVEGINLPYEKAIKE